MISYIKGEIVSAQNGTIILEANGIGYEIFASDTTIVKMKTQGKQIKLFCYLYVREDAMVLYGFHCTEEKNMFLKLIAINGLGPKAAMSILSSMELSNLAIAIIQNDVKTLSKTKGIGKKTAERIILELKGSICEDETNYEVLPTIENFDSDTQDAITALRSLGISQIEAIKSINKVKSQAKDIEELISLALKNL